MPDVNHVPVLNGQSSVAWGAQRSTDVDTLLFINQDLVNTIWIGQQSTITPAGTNTIPIQPNGTFSGVANTPWYVIGAAAGIQPLVVVPNGSAYFLGLTAGMGSLVIPSVQSPNFLTGVSGWQIRKDGSAEFNNIVIRGGETIGGTTLGYNGTPALGNMALSISTTGGTDAFGNVFRPGIWIYGPNGSQAGLEIFGGDAGIVLQPPNSAHLTSDPQIFGANNNAGAVNETEVLFLSSGQANTNPGAAIEIISEAADSSSLSSVWMIFNNAIVWNFQPTFTTYSGALQIASNVSAAFYIMPTINAPGAIAGNAQIFADTNGAPSAVMPSGLVGSMPLVQVDISSHSVGNTVTAGDITTAWTVPANDGVQGTTYKIECLAGVLMGATATETLTIGVDINGTKTALATLGATFNGSTVSKAYDIPIQLYLTVDEIGTNTPKVYLNGPLGDTTDNRLATDGANMSGHSNGTTWNKGSANTLAVYAQWGGTGGAAQTIGTTSSRLYREGP